MIIHGYGPFTLSNSNISECRWEFSGPAANVIQAMTMLYHGGGKDLVEKTIENIRKGSHPSDK